MVTKTKEAKQWSGFDGLNLRQQEAVMRVAPQSTTKEAIESFLKHLVSNHVIPDFELTSRMTENLINSVNRRRRQIAEIREKNKRVKRTSQVMPGGSPRTALELLRQRGVI